MKRNKLLLIFVFILSCTFCSKKIYASPINNNMLQNDVLLYNWNTSIEEIRKDFIVRQFQEIKISNDSISAKVNFFGLSSEIYFVFYNGKMVRGGILYLGFPGEPEGDDNYTLVDISRIKETIFKALTDKYGKPQETKETKRLSDGGHNSKWNLKNDRQLEFNVRVENFIMTSCGIDVVFTNIPLFEERRISLAPPTVSFPTHAEIISAVKKLGAREVYIREYTSRNRNYKEILSGNEGTSPANDRISLCLNYKGSISIKEVEKALDKLFVNAGFTTGDNFFTEGGRTFDIGKYIPLPTHAEIITLIKSLGASNIIISSYTSQGSLDSVNAGNEGSVPSNSYITIWLKHEGDISVSNVREALIRLFTKAGFTHYGVVDGRNFHINDK